MKELHNIVIFGLSITSSWGNGHATTYRGLVKELNALGYDVTFFEKDVYWYAENRDMPVPPFCKTILYKQPEELSEYKTIIKEADLVIVGSYVPDGITIGNFVLENAEGITAFYDIDTPVTIASIQSNKCEYLTKVQIAAYDIYLSFTGGPLLDKIEKEFGSPMARPLYCSVDPSIYFKEDFPKSWDLGYLGTYSPDRQIILDKLFIKAAIEYKEGKFILAGPQYPDSIKWPDNVKREIHLSPREHREFYNRQRFTLNITRENMVKAGYSPSVRLFEAAACGTPIISDYWIGLETIFELNKEILISTSHEETIHYLKDFHDDDVKEIAQLALNKVLLHHTAAHRAKQLLDYLIQFNDMKQIPKGVH